MEKKRSLKRKLCMAGIGVAARLSVPNRLHYWGAFPDKAPYIQIQIPETAVITIAPVDQDAVLLRVEPMCGLKRVYKLSRYGDFSEYAETLYDITGDPHFQA